VNHLFVAAVSHFDTRHVDAARKPVVSSIDQAVCYARSRAGARVTPCYTVACVATLRSLSMYARHRERTDRVPYSYDPFSMLHDSSETTSSGAGRSTTAGS
jgi:hypothetical protein